MSHEAHEQPGPLFIHLDNGDVIHIAPRVPGAKPLVGATFEQPGPLFRAPPDAEPSPEAESFTATDDLDGRVILTSYVWGVPPSQPHSPTSQAAAKSLSPEWLAGKRLAVWSAIRNAPDGLTDEEGVALTRMSPSTYRPRRVELQAAGLVVDSGQTRPSLAGRLMAVWRAAQ